ncbi:putative gamma-glutamyltranspeptidase [Calothrix sp. NIES-4071]|nr:putative gamma-glutamyltranspeptidase [Calothrix sp. NIES-4071]BAZ56957.1 putative gamma-glutamyltranspeptidase [Calothrix sp. NIES-4105]
MVISRKFGLRSCLLALILGSIVGRPDIVLTQDAPEAGSARVERKAVRTQKYMVAAANPIAAAVGRDILRRGGSAIDAAVAVQMVLGLVEPQSSGIGGGAFLVYYDAKTKRVRTFDGRETAPYQAQRNRFQGRDGKPLQFYDAVLGGKSVGVPGVVKMLEQVHKQYGKLPWSQLFQPAIQRATTGFPISPRLHTLLSQEKFLGQREPARRYFYQPDGTPKPVGAKLVNQQYANVLRVLAQKGAGAFYKGEIAQDIVNTVKNASVPGDLTTNDLARYNSVERPPVCGTYRVYKVCGMGPPTSGGITVLQILGMLQRFNLASLKPDSVQAVHLFAEAGRFAYADRGLYIADPDFIPVPTKELINPKYLQTRAALINPNRAFVGEAKPGNPLSQQAFRWGLDNSPEFPSTSHISIVDGNGNAVAMTTSIEDAFGARLMVRGFLLNNQLTDFSFSPTTDGKLVANRVQPRKRPRSSMAPMMVFDRNGKLVMVVGSAGGPLIINYVAKAIVGVLDWKLDTQQALSLPNFGNRNGATELEANTNIVNLKPQLEALGHTVTVREQTSGSQAIVITNQGKEGGVDPRREGIAIGD